MKNKDIIALERVFELVKEFLDKNIIRKSKINFERIANQIERLKETKSYQKDFKSVVKKLRILISRDLTPKIFHMFGAHGGIIIHDIGFCEFDSPAAALEKIKKKMQISMQTKQPYNLEIAICCFEWLKHHNPSDFSEFLTLFNSGKFEIMNPSYSQPYNLIIGPESNIKQFEYGIRILKELKLTSPLFYCSESSYHPQIPQILEQFNIKYGSLRARLLGNNPTANSPVIYWRGLDNTSIKSLIDQSGVFNGEYWHGTYFRELPNLLFQAVARPFMENILYSSIEDFMNNQPLQEEVWRVANYNDLFGKFLLCSEIFDIIEVDGEYKYSRDSFTLGNYIFLISELFLENKKAEIMLISSEIINAIAHYNDDIDNNSLIDELWKKLLLSQAHDCYAVPYIKTGDYSRAQLPKDEYEALGTKKGDLSISELGILLCKEVQKQCEIFINSTLLNLTEKLGEKSRKDSKNVFVFNPTPYNRCDIVKIENSDLKYVLNVPAFGYTIVPLEKVVKSDLQFFFNIQISSDSQKIQVKFKNIFGYNLSFSSEIPYSLIIVNKAKDNVEERIVIQGIYKNKEFNLDIVQYKGINRLEFILNSKLFKEIIIEPNLEITNYYVNYPFGIEETKRSNIQSLD
ncbi:MAG: hypothetical protein ACFFKA_08195, partial [Candidatus Thorarchaeota archaeon]